MAAKAKSLYSVLQCPTYDKGACAQVQFTTMSSQSNHIVSIHSRCRWPRFATPLSNDTRQQAFFDETCTYLRASIVISLRALHANASTNKKQTRQNKERKHTSELTTLQCGQFFGNLMGPPRRVHTSLHCLSPFPNTGLIACTERSLSFCKNKFDVPKQETASKE